jgi:mono/diheme cytochrome c family protein
MKKSAGIFVLGLIYFQASFADIDSGKRLYESRCAVCHGVDAKATGRLAQKSNPPTPDLTTTEFKKRLADYPGVIVASVVLRPNGNLIPNILRENGVKIPTHVWTEDELRALNQYMLTLIFPKTETSKVTVKPQ